MGCLHSKESSLSSLENRTQFLSSTPFAIRMDSEQLRTFASFFHVRSLKKGEEVYALHDHNYPAGDFHIVLSGRVNLTVDKSIITTKGPPLPPLFSFLDCTYSCSYANPYSNSYLHLFL